MIKSYLKLFVMLTLLSVAGFSLFSSINIEAIDVAKESSFVEATKAVEQSTTEQSTLIKLKPNAYLNNYSKNEVINKLASQNNLKIEYTLPNLNSFVAKVNKTKLANLKKSSLTAEAQKYQSIPGPILPMASSPQAITATDEYPRYQKAIGITDNNSRRGLTGLNQVIGVIDTGVDFSNPELAGKSVAEGCFSDVNKEAGIKSYSLCPNGSNSQTGIGSSKPCEGLPGCNHGSHVSGIAAGRSTSRNHAGIAPDAKIVAVNVFHIVENKEKCTPKNNGKFKDFTPPATSKCIFTSNFAYLKAIDFMIDQNKITPLAAVNMSLGTYETKNDNCDDKETPNFHALIDQGVPLIIASGNSYNKGQMSHPACQSRVISVGAYDEALKTDLFFSNVSPNTTIFAPGFQIKSIGIGMSGTSMAAPMVAGTSALLSQAGIKGHENLKANLVNNATKFNSKNTSNGKVINLTKSLPANGFTPSPTPIPEPKPTPTPKPTPVPTPVPTPKPETPSNSACKSGALGWCAQYFNNKNLSGTPTVTKTIPALDRYIDMGSPDPKINKDLYSARFKSTFSVANGQYHTFAYSFDDGVRISIKRDGGQSEYIVYDWRNKAPQETELDKILPAGEYEITIEYYENYLGATQIFEIFNGEGTKMMFYNI
jgi:subtilisin family serine protease